MNLTIYSQTYKKKGVDYTPIRVTLITPFRFNIFLISISNISLPVTKIVNVPSNVPWLESTEMERIFTFCSFDIR